MMSSVETTADSVAEGDAVAEDQPGVDPEPARSVAVTHLVVDEDRQPLAHARPQGPVLHPAQGQGQPETQEAQDRPGRDDVDQRHRSGARIEECQDAGGDTHDQAGDEEDPREDVHREIGNDRLGPGHLR